MQWETLIPIDALAALLPPEYAHFSRPIRDGLAVFLGGLPDADQQMLVTQQASLPPTATLSERLGLLAQGCPVLQKLGQILARDSRLAAELRSQLRALESLPPSIPWETIQASLIDELGPLQERGIELLPPAIAEASVAVVVGYRQAAGHGAGGVLKILKPGIEDRLGLELGMLDRVGAHLDERCSDLQIPQLDYQESFQTVRDKLFHEIMLDQEQNHLRGARAFYDADRRIQIPVLRDHCTRRVTAMERISGGKITDHCRTLPRDRRRLGGMIADALIAQPIFSDERAVMFHSDPHAGNLFLTNDGRLAILDWSLVGELGIRERTAVAQIMLSAMLLDASSVTAVVESLAERPVDRAALTRLVEERIRDVRWGKLPGLAWLIRLFDDAVRYARLRASSDMMLFRKSLHTLEGVIRDVGADRNHIDRVLMLRFLRNFALEWPNRWLSWPASRRFATRLSNLDLTRAMLSYPSTVARFWGGHLQDLAELGCRAWIEDKRDR